MPPHRFIGQPFANEGKKILRKKWERFPKWESARAWQAGYGAFSVSESNVAAAAKYIATQDEHHKKRSFQEEFVAFLKKNKVAYDERYIWD